MNNYIQFEWNNIKVEIDTIFKYGVNIHMLHGLLDGFKDMNYKTYEKINIYDGMNYLYNKNVGLKTITYTNIKKSIRNKQRIKKKEDSFYINTFYKVIKHILSSGDIENKLYIFVFQHHIKSIYKESDNIIRVKDNVIFVYVPSRENELDDLFSVVLSVYIKSFNKNTFLYTNDRYNWIKNITNNAQNIILTDIIKPTDNNIDIPEKSKQIDNNSIFSLLGNSPNSVSRKSTYGKSTPPRLKKPSHEISIPPPRFKKPMNGNSTAKPNNFNNIAPENPTSIQHGLNTPPNTNPPINNNKPLSRQKNSRHDRFVPPRLQKKKKIK